MSSLDLFNFAKRNLRYPADASKEAEEIIAQVRRLPTIRDMELLELKDNFEGDHAKLIPEYIKKPPPWDEATWDYVRRGLMAINTTRTSLRSLASGVYGGVQARQIESEKGPFKDQLNQLVVSPEWRKAMKRLMNEVALYGTGYLVPAYDRESRRFTLRHLNPLTTHILTSEMDPEEPVAVVEIDPKRNWMRIWHRSFSAVLARKEEDVEYREYVDDAENPVPLPYFPVLIAKSEDVPGSPYGISKLRDTPKFNRALAVAYFNVTFSSLLKAQALLVLSSGSEDGGVEAEFSQLGPHSSIILPKGSAASFISNNADVSSLMSVIEGLQALESYVLGIPNIQAQKNLSAEGARLAATPLTSQIGDLSLTMTSVETRGIHLTAMVGHWAVESPATPEDAERMYQVTVKINPSVNVDSLSERVSNKLALADRGVVPEETVVAEFNETMTYPEVVAQAEVMRERRGKGADKKASTDTGDGSGG